MGLREKDGIKNRVLVNTQLLKGAGGMFPQKILHFRFFKIAFGAFSGT